MTAYLLPNAKQCYSLPSGLPNVGGKVYTYAAGTSTPKTTWQDAAQVTPNANPVILDARGEAPIYWNGSYKIVLTDSVGGVIWTQDNVSSYDFSMLSNLPTSSGSSLIGFIQSGTGAVARTVQDKLRSFVDVKDYGAKGDGATDDTAAIQAAVNFVGTMGGLVRFPAGTYKITSAINMASQSVKLVGDSRYAVLISQATLNAKILNITGNFCGFDGMSFIYAGTPASGATAVFVSSSYVTLSNFVIRSSYVAIEFSGASAVAGKIADFELLDYESIGLYAHDLNDLFVSQFIMNAGNSTRGALGGIRLLNRAEAIVVSDGDILNGAYSMAMDATSYTQNNRPAYNNFTNVFFDSAVYSTQINKCVETEFVGCWFSGGRSGGGNAGAVVTSSQSIRFTNTRFFNCGASGVTVDAASTQITFTACDADSNSVTSGAGVSHGFQFANNTAQFQLIGCTASNGLYTGTQGYGVFIGSGCDQFRVEGGNFIGNATGPILDGATAATNKIILGNLGYVTASKGTGTIFITQTVATITHGLAGTPNAEDISVGFTTAPAASGVVSLYVAAIGATTFQIVSNAAVAGANCGVSWQARIKGA